jgi:NodT family efflux transporter outer membrane factor (OMF) lipoprotein
VLVVGCVGPRYRVPNVTTPANYKETAPAAYAGASAGTWEPAQPQDAALKGKWWEIFAEPELSELEEQLNINNQNLAQFFQNFMAARAQVSEARAAYFPTLTASPSATRSHSARTTNGTTTVYGGGGAVGSGSAGVVSGGGTTYNEFSLPLDVSWAPDLWGRIRNSVRESRYAAQVSAADLENERLTEQAVLAQYYFQLRGQDSLQALYDQTIQAHRQALELTRVLFETGIDNPEDVAQAESTLANTEANATGVAKNRALYEHAIATLIGKPASEFSMPVKNLTTPLPTLPVGLPSQLLQRRPDVAAAERAMAQANARIGVETAAYYPSLDLTARGGFQSSVISSLFTAPARFWSLGASAAETLFDAGLRKATIEQYTAQFNASVASYRQTVLNAFQQVEDYSSTLRVTSQQIERQKAAVAATQRFLDIATARYQTGIDPYLNVMTAQTNLLADQQTQVTLQVNEMLAAVQLVQALGGGWEVSELQSL